MKNRIILIVFFALIRGLSGQAQVINSLEYLDHIIIDKKVGDGKIGGLSGITLNTKTGSYLLAADKPPSRIFATNINLAPALGYDLNQTIYLEPSLLSNSELEGIAYSVKSDSYYVSDEQSDGTRIFEIDGSGTFKRIVYPLNKPFLPLSGHNSGIEGLTLSKDGEFLFFAFERPSKSCITPGVTTIGKLSLEDSTVESFAYQLHTVENDNLNTNGISDILYLNDTTVLVMERAYIPGQGNVVRLFETYLISNNTTAVPINCETEVTSLSRAKLVFDFADVTGFKIDNAEGMTFNEDRSELYLVTDDNFSKKQQSQLIVMKVRWE